MEKVNQEIIQINSTVMYSMEDNGNENIGVAKHIGSKQNFEYNCFLLTKLFTDTIRYTLIVPTYLVCS